MQSHFEIVADAISRLSVDDMSRLGRNPFRVVGLVEDTMNSGGDPAMFIPLRDAQVLQTQLAPPAPRGVRPVNAAAVARIILVMLAFRLHIQHGGAYEMRTVAAMALRIAIWAVISKVAWTYIRQARAH